MISFQKFSATYEEALKEVMRNWSPILQDELAVHNIGWGPDNFDFNNYLRCSVKRYYQVYLVLEKNDLNVRFCDVGGFFGVFPITLKMLDYSDVTMTEALQYYGAAFDPLFACIKKYGVNIIDIDMFQEQAKVGKSFDFISLMAVIEHYPHSLKILMQNLSNAMTEDGKLYIEVPNIAHFYNRLYFLFGRSPLTDISTKYNSAVPFIGHHHEFTSSELVKLADISRFTVINEYFYNYSDYLSSGINLSPLTLMYKLFTTFFKNTRECISVELKKNSTVVSS